jgi:hypothetical protein
LPVLELVLPTPGLVVLGAVLSVLLLALLAVLAVLLLPLLSGLAISAKAWQTTSAIESDDRSTASRLARLRNHSATRRRLTSRAQGMKWVTVASRRSSSTTTIATS